MKRILILASGEGTIFQAIVEAIQAGDLNAELVALGCNCKTAPVLERARTLGVEKFLVESAAFKKDSKFDRSAYEAKLMEEVKNRRPEVICLAGYMLILGKDFIRAFPNQILNIHPSLLPKFRGLNTHRQALAAGEKETGCTVHWVTEELDAGPIILQERIPILPGDTEEKIQNRLRPVEHQTYIRALKMVLS